MKVRLADYIADFLFGHGIDHNFTVTGGGAMFLNDAFGKHKGIKCIYNHHEQASAVAAEGFFRVSGRPALVCVTTGPGGTNALTGVLGAYLDSIPMIVISGQVKLSTTTASTDLPLRQLGDQEWCITKTAAGMTKYAVMVTDPLLIKYHLQRAIFLANHGRPGPVWLDIPINIQSATIETDDLAEYNPAEDAREIPAPIPLSIVEKVAELIKKAKKPLIFAGTGVWLSGSVSLLRQLVDKTEIPFVTAWGSNDLIESSHPLYVGRPGTVGDRQGNFAVSNCDLLIVLGSRLNIRTISYNYENFAKKAYKVVVDIDSAELKKPTVKADLPICGDVFDFLNLLLPSVERVDAPKWTKYCTMLRTRFDVVESDYYKKDAPVNPYCFARALSEKLREGDVTVCANATAAVCTMQAAVIKHGQKYFSNSGVASMGHGLPASLGAAVAVRAGYATDTNSTCLNNDINNANSTCINSNGGISCADNSLCQNSNNDGFPCSNSIDSNCGNNCGTERAAREFASLYDYKDRRVVCLEGDGSLMMNIQELMTLAKNKLPVKLFVLNNRGYHSIRQSQTAFFGHPLVGVGEDSDDLAFFDLPLIAAAAGLPYHRIESHSQFDIIDSVLNHDGAIICEVMLDKTQNFAPKLSSKKLPDGTIVSPSPEDMFPFLDEDLVKELNNI